MAAQARDERAESRAARLRLPARRLRVGPYGRQRTAAIAATADAAATARVIVNLLMLLSSRRWTSDCTSRA